MIIYNTFSRQRVTIQKDTIIRKKICDTNINALHYCNTLRANGRKAWIDSNVCYYI